LALTEASAPHSLRYPAPAQPITYFDDGCFWRVPLDGETAEHYWVGDENRERLEKLRQFDAEVETSQYEKSITPALGKRDGPLTGSLALLPSLCWLFFKIQKRSHRQEESPLLRA
jgi:hypothetical protein